MKRNGKIYLLLLLLSFGLTVVLSEYKGDKWEENIRQAYYHHMLHRPIPSYYQVLIDSDGIPFVEYASYNGVSPGKRYLPTTVSIYAIDYYHQLQQTNNGAVRQKFFNCVEWLASHMTSHDNYALYEFTWQQPFYPNVGTPWRSGLSSGKAIEAFVCAYQVSHSEKYINYSMSLLRGFYQPIQNGGFTYQENNGWWYEEYADSQLKTPRVLNGHIYAFLGVHQLWKLTGNDSASYIFNQGLESLKNNLNKYDAGNGWSFYDSQRKKSDKLYHKMMVGLMNQLWTITNDKFYYNYYIKWKAPLNELYLIRIVKEKNRSGILLFLLFNGLIATSLFSVYFIKNKLYTKV